MITGNNATPKRKRAPGGGRKPTVRGVKVAATLGQEHLDYLAAIDANRSAAIRRVIEEHRGVGIAYAAQKYAATVGCSVEHARMLIEGLIK